MTISVAPVLVVGAGPAGLAAALTLLQNNVPIRIVTKESEYRQVGQRGAGILPRTFEVFHFLRVFEILRDAKPPLPILEYKPGTLEPRESYMMFHHSDSTPSIPYINPKALGQQVLEGILRSHLEKHGCSVELGTELQSFEEDEERVLAKLVKRKDGEEATEIFEASYVIGADGAKGVTRKQLGLTFLGETRQDFSSVTGDLCLEIDGLDRDHWHFFGDRSSNFFSLRPTDEVAPDGYQLFIYTKDYESGQLCTDQTLMVKCMSELTGQDVNIRKAIALTEFRLNIRMVDKFGIGRVFVAGDAAHVHSPTGGQGLNSSVQDSFNLAWKLSLVYKGLAPASLLDSYTTERLPVIAEMLNITTGILNKMSSGSAGENMRREKRLDMLGVNCRSSPIVLDEFTHAEPVNPYGVLEEGVLVAGDRAPDAPELASAGKAKSPARLFDMFRPIYHTVLMFAPDVPSSADVLEVLRRFPGDAILPVIILPQGSEVATGAQADIVVDHTGHAYRAYLAVEGETKVVVVRPDGVVGAMVRSAKGVMHYFSKIFV